MAIIFLCVIPNFKTHLYWIYHFTLFISKCIYCYILHNILRTLKTRFRTDHQKNLRIILGNVRYEKQFYQTKQYSKKIVRCGKIRYILFILFVFVTFKKENKEKEIRVCTHTCTTVVSTKVALAVVNYSIYSLEWKLLLIIIVTILFYLFLLQLLLQGTHVLTLQNVLNIVWYSSK